MSASKKGLCTGLRIGANHLTMSHAGMSTGDSLVGTTLAGRYRVEARVGSGAMGAVYRAEQAGLGRRVALKIVNRGRQVDHDTIQRFRREATALSALHHPNTVRVFDFGSTNNGLLYLAMELLEGEPLTTYMARQAPLPLADALSITQQVLRSIGEAHARGIVHRDLKPDNIFLARVPAEPAPIVKVLDFGIAKAVAGDHTINQFETLDGTVFGTPRYMSPEQAGGRTLDARSDLYSVGIMLYELIAGQPPFVDNDAVVVMAKHIRDKPAPLSRAAPQRAVPPSLEALVSRALAKQAAERFQTAEELERGLERCRRDLASGVRVQVGRVIRNKRVLWGAAACVALAAAGGAIQHARAPEPLDRPAALATSVSTHAQTDLKSAEDPTRRAGLASSDNSASRNVVSVQSAPPAAAVLQNGAELGVTPLEVSMNKGSRLILTLKKKGFAEHKLELRAEDRSRVVALRRLGDKDRDRDRERPSASARRSRERTLPRNSPPVAPEPSAPPSAEKSSPYERF